MTSLVHGNGVLEGIHAEAKAAFGEGERQPIDAKELSETLTLLEALVACGLASSRSEGRRLIRSNAVRVDGQAIEDESALLADVIGLDAPKKVSAGKKKHVFVVCKRA